MGRAHDILIPPETSWLTDPAAREVCDAITAGGFDIYFVGGCVRNALLGLPGNDVDLSTNALPKQVMTCAEAAGLKAVPTGIDHGTVTVVASGAPFEITTFRRDVETDGRRAVVAFSSSIKDDARRRDFTINALYACPDGAVIDPLGGLPDLRERRIRFIEDPGARIREDYLRILRFFRFTAWYADPALGFDADALAAIAANLDGLETLPAERNGHEIKRLLASPDPAPAVAVMRQIGVLARILPGADDTLLAPLVHLECVLEIPVDWITRLAAIGGEDVADRLRLSRADARQLKLLADVGFAGPSVAEIAYRHGKNIAQGALLLRSVMAQEPPETPMLETINTASVAKFPVAAKDLMPTLQGPDLGAKLAVLEQQWIDSGFTLTRTELLRET